MLADTGYLQQFLVGGLQHRGKGAEPVHQGVGQFIGVPLGDGEKEKQLQHPVGRQVVQVVFQELLLYPFPVPVVDPHDAPPFPAALVRLL